MKKTIALLAAVVLLLTLIVPAYAAGVTIDTSKTGSFTIYKYDMTTATGNGINLRGDRYGTWVQYLRTHVPPEYVR